MQLAIDVASKDRNEVPVGAVVVRFGEVIAESNNRILADNDPTAHAEILVIRNACKILNSYNLSECDLYTTLEPCPMCAYAIALAKIKNLYFAAYDPKRGVVYSHMNIFKQKYCFHIPSVHDGIMEHESCAMILKFFSDLRKSKNKL